MEREKHGGNPVAYLRRLVVTDREARLWKQIGDSDDDDENENENENENVDSADDDDEFGDENNDDGDVEMNAMGTIHSDQVPRNSTQTTLPLPAIQSVRSATPSSSTATTTTTTSPALQRRSMPHTSFVHESPQLFCGIDLCALQRYSIAAGCFSFIATTILMIMF
eukprot:TRINITY_DN3467_c0_g1_i1.p1 TRINITY_DN3467_c0_g1~~TRINITY_DN3467_c0_g1_i1.p1  ORF type:complete len:166 (+),score=52.01 TRINITY_DN3467_c0_g1_i1:60-557(+)